MAEYGLTDNVIGLIMDGTGYGDDGAIWGGEVFILQNGEIARKYHLEYVPQAAGDASVRYPSRMAQSWLMSAGVWSDFWRERMGMTETEAKLNGGMIRNNINTIPTSSAGRLFESVGAMVLGINKNEYEAHAAMALEAVATTPSHGRADPAPTYPYEIANNKIIMTPVIRAIAADVSDNVNASHIAQKFHNTFALVLADCAIKLSEISGIKGVALSGGVFQNKLLLEQVEKLLVKAGLNCYIPINIPANDGCIALGQAYYVVVGGAKS
jgi:hydrogenase maturation protein HypF